MNYQKFHDEIISRALSRQKEQNVYYENHHLTPICEDGDKFGPLVSLTFKEHRLIHYLRYKITKVSGNMYAYNCMKCGEDQRRKNAVFAAKRSHQLHKERDPVGYAKKQGNVGKLGGDRCAREKIGFHQLPEEAMKVHRAKGTKTLIERKLGIFDPNFIEQHRLKLFKKVQTPIGVYDQMKEAADANGCCSASVTYRVNQKSARFAQWFYIQGEFENE